MCITSVKLSVFDTFAQFAATTVQHESKNPPCHFLTFFPKQLGIFSPSFRCLLYIPIYARLQSNMSMHHHHYECIALCFVNILQ